MESIKLFRSWDFYLLPGLFFDFSLLLNHYRFLNLRFRQLLLSKEAGKPIIVPSKTVPILGLGCRPFLFLHPVHPRQRQRYLLLCLILLGKRGEINLRWCIFGEINVGVLTGEEVGEEIIVNTHVVALGGFQQIEQAPLDDKGVIVGASSYWAWLSLVENLTVNGQFRFS